MIVGTPAVLSVTYMCFVFLYLNLFSVVRDSREDKETAMIRKHGFNDKKTQPC